MVFEFLHDVFARIKDAVAVSNIVHKRVVDDNNGP